MLEKLAEQGAGDLELSRLNLAERLIADYLAEHGSATLEELTELIAEKVAKDKSSAEKLVKAALARLIKASKVVAKDGKYSHARQGKQGWSRHWASKYKGPTYLDQPKPKVEPKDVNPYWHPATEADRRAYERARKKWGKGADYVA